MAALRPLGLLVIALVGALGSSSSETPGSVRVACQEPSHLGAWEVSIHGLEQPVAVAIDPGGRIHIAEAGAGRVRVFERDGTPAGEYGADRLDEPAGLAIAPDGTAFVCDSGRHEVLAFGEDGAFLRSWGGLGSEPSELHRPRGLCVDAERVAVADAGNRRVQVFDHEGALRGSHTLDQTSAPLPRPVDVAFGLGGDVFFVDAERHRVERLSRRQLEPGGTLGEFGFPPGTFARPLGLAAAGGRLFVADTENHRIQVFDEDEVADRDGAVTARQPLYTFGRHAIRPREGRGRLHYPAAVAVARDRSFAVLCEPRDDRVQVLGRAPGERPERDPRGGAGGQAAPHFGAEIAVDRDWMTLVEPETQRVLVYDLRQLDGSRRNDPIRISTFGGLGTRLGLFSSPAGLDLDMDDRSLYVCDAGSQRLQHVVLDFDPEAPVGQNFDMARFVRMLDFVLLGKTFGDRDLEWLVQPIAVARRSVEDAAEVLVLDAANALVLVLDEHLDPERSFGGRDTLARPTDLAYGAGSDEIYVVDAQRAEVVAFSPSGKVLARFGEGAFEEPYGIACAADGTLWISDPGRNEVVHCSARGEVLRRVGGRGIRRGEFYRPRGLAFRGNGELYVVDHANHRGIVLSPDGEYLDAFGSRLYTKPAKKPDSYRAEDYVE